jgi:hypothetical protein
MTTEPFSAGDDPRELLSATHEVAQRVRRAQRATWFPLLVFAAVIFAALPVERFGHRALTCRAVLSALPSGRICSIYSAAAFVYWPIALVAAYITIAASYVRRSQARGLGTRIRPYVTVGIIVAVAVIAASLWAAHHPPIGGYDILGLHLQAQSSVWFLRVASPFGAIGLALLVLAWGERNRALLVFTLGYLAIMLVPPTTRGSAVAHASPWSFLPHFVVNGCVLALGGIGFALAQRPIRPPPV